MNDDFDKDETRDDPLDDPADTVARLMHLAGPRTRIPADRQSRVHDKVRQEWLRATRKKKAARWAVPLALAASLLVALSVTTRLPEVQAPAIGTIAYIAGDGNGGNLSLAVGDVVHAGDLVESGEQGLSVSLRGDVSLRIDAGTAIRFDRQHEFTLLAGRIYADSGERIYRDSQLTIHTANGSVTDVGTQFSVEFGDDQLEVAVREGRVDVRDDQETHVAVAGESVSILPNDEVTRRAIAPYDESWKWASSLAPAYVIEDQSLLDFLKWASRETGKELVFANDELRMAAMGTTLFGSVDDFTPQQAAESVLATTRFTYRITQQSIAILE